MVTESRVSVTLDSWLKIDEFFLGGHIFLLLRFNLKKQSQTQVSPSKAQRQEKITRSFK